MNSNTEDLKKVFKWGAVVLMVLAVFLAVEALGSFKDLRNSGPYFNTISVTGEGEAVVIPDIAAFSFSVSADANTVSAAQASVTEKMNTILAELKTLGIEDRDIKTTDYSVYPKYTYTTSVCSPTFCPPARTVQDGYTANHSISLKIRNTEEAGAALSRVGELGATNISSISFTVDDMEQVLADARDEAIKDAKEKAKTLSKSLGVKLVKIVSFYDNTGGSSPEYREMALGSDTAVLSTPKIPTGENKALVNVTLIYEIR